VKENNSIQRKENDSFQYFEDFLFKQSKIEEIRSNRENNLKSLNNELNITLFLIKLE
jgi:hypothetical protein